MKLREAIKKWEDENNLKMSDQFEVKLLYTTPPIEKMDNAGLLKISKNCKKLSLSSNNIEKIGNFNDQWSLVTLSLGRNNIKVIQNLENLSDTLEDLWLSYNKISRLTGLSSLKKLKTLYLVDNLIESW